MAPLLRAPSALPSQNPSVKLGRLKKCKLTEVDSDTPVFVDALGDQGRPPSYTAPPPPQTWDPYRGRRAGSGWDACSKLPDDLVTLKVRLDYASPPGAALEDNCQVNDLLAGAPLPAYLRRRPTWSRQRR
ncbi:hypothetical protein Bbelb_377090 [Branchiostoma belcheri]|nr:hypothetical protein Bbelb_377090 [Branchiostoma belcheri]